MGNTEADTLVYSEDRLVLRKEYVGDFLDYNHNYIYNSENQLVKISTIHSTSTIPSEETIYTFYPDGNLKTRHYVGYNSNYTQTFTYYDNFIYINEGTNDAIRMTLNADGYISAADKFYEDLNEFINYINFEYDANGNIKKVSERYSRNDPYRLFTYTFDDKINPLFIFDYKLPNGFTIKQLEAVSSHLNFGGYAPGEDDNMIMYFNKNNFITIESENGVSEFNFEYDAENYPIKIILPYNNNDEYLILEYKE